ncbi:MAG TPA: hypothetical protein VNZ43_04805 [Sphingomonadaceae bacterium]|nr:hypothetical protein [Sphingomonadaceae bacterium]
MILADMFVLMLAASAAPVPREAPPLAYAQLTIRQSIIIRVPTRAIRPSRPIEYREQKAAKCQPMADIAGAAVVKPDNIDIIYRGGLRLRAELEDACPALDYYGGFYIRPTRDGQICAGRDVIRSRAGGECRIRRFRKLVPKRER